jgi:hypothetical protein
MTFILLVAAAVFLAFAAFNVPSPSPRLIWGWLGMFLWCLSILLPSLLLMNPLWILIAILIVVLIIFLLHRPRV